MNPELLTPVFREHLHPDTDVVSVTRGPVGNGQEIWMVDTCNPNRSLVLRRSADSGPLTWTDRESEYEVLRSLAHTGLPIPTVLWSGDADAGLSRSYFVMDRMPGRPVLRESPETLRRVASGLGESLAKLHLSGVGNDDPLSTAAEATRQQITMWRERYLADRLGPVPLIGVLLAWLEHHAPSPSAEPVVLWGDPGPHNILHVDGEISALLDWELSHVGDPLEDLGAAVWACSGGCDPETIVTGYERELGSPIDRGALTYFETLACVTRSIMLLSAVGRYSSGETTAPNLAGLGLQLIQSNLERAVRLTGHNPPETPEIAIKESDLDRLRPDIAELLAGVAAFLRDDVRPQVSDGRVTRGLKTVDALLATVALRVEIEDSVSGQRRSLRGRLLDDLQGAGVDVSGGIENAAIIVETEPRFASHRPAMWRALVEDLGLTRAMLQPLADIYQ